MSHQLVVNLFAFEYTYYGQVLAGMDVKPEAMLFELDRAGREVASVLFRILAIEIDENIEMRELYVIPVAS